MNGLYTINYLIFSAFLTLFLVELGVAITVLFSYEKYREKLKRYVNPIWEVNGTFIIFYLVNFEATYPKLLPIIGEIYLVPAFLAFFFFILRNSFLAYSGYQGDKAKEHKYMKIYSISTIMIALFAISILTSSVTGAGIDLTNNTASLVGMIARPFNIAVIISAILIATFIASNYFEINELRRYSILGVLAAVLIILGALYIYANWIFINILANPELLIVSLILLLLAILISLKNDRRAAHIAMVWLLLSINIFGAAQYPYLFGGSTEFTQYLTNSSTGYYVLLISVVCGSALVLAIALLVYINYIKKPSPLNEAPRS